jgi:hypothetical protein
MPHMVANTLMQRSSAGIRGYPSGYPRSGVLRHPGKKTKGAGAPVGAGNSVDPRLNGPFSRPLEPSPPPRCPHATPPPTDPAHVPSFVFIAGLQFTAAGRGSSAGSHSDRPGHFGVAPTLAWAAIAHDQTPLSLGRTPHPWTPLNCSGANRRDRSCGITQSDFSAGGRQVRFMQSQSRRRRPDAMRAGPPHSPALRPLGEISQTKSLSCDRAQVTETSCRTRARSRANAMTTTPCARNTSKPPSNRGLVDRDATSRFTPSRRRLRLVY